MPIMQDFNPAVDGWYFENWGEQPPYCIGSCDFSWELYRRSYLGINPTHDCIEAPLDCAFYEIFKNCAEQGNCGGMSLLALALFKYGGYMGFCSPASFYTGVKSPDREDLHRAINVLQARQFSASGIENFLDAVDGGILNNAVTAFNQVKQLLGTADYPVLSIAKDSWGDAAHTVIPYRWEENPAGYPFGTKILYIWDPNHPFDADPGHYSSSACHLVIKSPTDWSYTSGSNQYSGGGWCFVIPMSTVLHKSRHPMALDMVFDALMTLFVTGPGAAVTQISDDSGRRLYSSAPGAHLSRRGLETDPAKRLTGIGRWPWYGGSGRGSLPGELYFGRRSVVESGLNFRITGSRYRLVRGVARNMVEIEVESRYRGGEEIRIGGLGGASQRVEIQPLKQSRRIHLRHLRQDPKTGGWRSLRVRNLRVPRQGVTLNVWGDLEVAEIQSNGLQIQMEVELEQRLEGQLRKVELGLLKAPHERWLRLSPRDWSRLDNEGIRPETVRRP
jgi:hypothetical protein